MPDYSTFSFKDKNGKPDGLDVNALIRDVFP